MLRIKIAVFLLFCAVALPIQMGMDGRLDKGSDYLALGIVILVLLVSPAALLIIFGRRAVKRTAQVLKAARAKIEAGEHIDVVEISRELRLKETAARTILDSAKRRGVLPPQAEIR